MKLSQLKQIIKEEVQNILLNETTINAPIIPDAIKALSKNPNAIEFTNKQKYDEFARKQKYFSASHSWAFYSKKEYDNWTKNHTISDDAEKSDILFDTGRRLVQVWDNKHKVGYIIPANIKEEIQSMLLETKISDITNEYLNSEQILINAQKKRDEAEKNYNRVYSIHMKAGDEKLKAFQSELTDELAKKLNVAKISDNRGQESLIEIFVDKKNGKISVHNRKYLSNPNGKVEWKIFNYRSHSYTTVEGQLPENMSSKQAVAYIIKQIKSYEAEHKTGIKWLK